MREFCFKARVIIRLQTQDQMKVAKLTLTRGNFIYIKEIPNTTKFIGNKINKRNLWEIQRQRIHTR